MSTHFHSLKVAEVRRETDDAVSVKFEVPEALRPVFTFKAGQHVTLRAEINGDEVRRNYSVCVAPHDGELRVAIKQITGGIFSTWANSQLTAGSALEVMPPHGSFTWNFERDASRHYVGIAGGSGITPVLSLLRTALIEEPYSRFTLIYGNRNSASIIFLEQLAALKNRFLDRLEVFHILSDEEEEVDLFNGMLNRAKCDELFDRLISPNDVAAFFICGPGPMMDAAEAALLDRSVPKERILIERFTADRPSATEAAKNASLAAQAAGHKVTVILDGRRRPIVFDPAKGNILDNARAAGLPAPFACKAGVCATCRAKVVSGKAEMATNYGLSESEVASGYVLTCQAVPVGDDVVIDFDA